ncbi:thiolase family protein [Saccharospirillum salsuginis]|uniref:Acetyl-CoA acetyltransferase n=1 Tax=Saccharospirillum salsuginis TaxID=418750 RepID=A0A918KJ86_9GAMM|nr:acetyl-CoA C-acetyltransferase [Saccharospirillum salsuginis]GGX65433.1 acetyl-CoA acetyltransferase [Saccharospirillum salsuginis]
MTKEIVIVAAKRTPMGGFQGALSPLSGTDLGAAAIKANLELTGLTSEQIQDVLMGCVLPAGLGQAPARQAALKSGLTDAVPATTVNKVCGSGMKTVMLAADQMRAGDIDIAIAGGMESMSNAPYLLSKARSGYRMGHQQMYDHMFLDGLEDAYDGRAMGVHAQTTADEFGIEREAMDEFALRSLSRAQKAIDEGWFKSEIAPVTIADRKGETVVEHDEQPGLARPDKIPSLRPAFAKDGTITAANSSSISDGAAALTLMTREKAEKLGLTPLATIRSYASHAQKPSTFTCAPIGAMNKALEKAGWRNTDVELAEINEAFAMVTMLGMKEVGLSADITNVNGGACALGHPLGCSGARIIVTLLHNMIRLDQRKGLAALCIGGGEGTAICIER